MSDEAQARILRRIGKPPNVAYENPFHITNGARFAALADEAEIVMGLNESASHCDLEPAQRDKWNAYVRQITITMCAAAKAQGRYFRNRPQFQMRASMILGRLAKVYDLASVDELQSKFQRDVQALHDEAPGDPSDFRPSLEPTECS
jgi:hypothetical protein